MAAETAAPSGEGSRSAGGGLGRGGPSRPDENEATETEAREAPATQAAAAPGSEEQECRVCYNAFDAEARVPKMLECLHTFCLACLKQMLHHQALRGGGGGPLAAASLACPLCRHRTALLSEERLRLLPLNTKLLPPPPPPAPARLQLLPLAEAAPRPVLQRPLPVQGGQRRESPPGGPSAASAACYALEQSRSQEVRTVRCVCVVFTFFSLMVISITGPLFLNYSGWVELFMVSLFLVVAIVLALFSVVPYFLHSHRYRAGGRAGSGPVAAAALGRIVLSSRS